MAPAEERQVGVLRIRIDRGLCVGFGDCIEAAPEAFRLDGENVVVFTEPERVERDAPRRRLRRVSGGRAHGLGREGRARSSPRRPRPAALDGPAAEPRYWAQLSDPLDAISFFARPHVHRGLRPGRQLAALGLGGRARDRARAALEGPHHRQPRLRGAAARRALPAARDRPARPVPDAGRDQAPAEDPRQADREGAAAHRRQLPRPGGQPLRDGGRAPDPAAARGHQLRGDRPRGQPRRGPAARADRLRPQPRGGLRRGRARARRRAGGRRRTHDRRGRGRGRAPGRHLRAAATTWWCSGPTASAVSRYSQVGGVATRALRGIQKDALVVRDDRPLQGGRIMVCVDGSSYSYMGMRRALELAQAFGASLYVCSAFDVEYHHVVFHNIKDVLSVQASKVFKFEEQEELHNNIIDKGLLKLCQANLKRAEVMAQEFPGVEVKTQILVGKPFQVVLQWAEEVQPSLLVLARHGAHRVEGTDLGSQAENLVRLAALQPPAGRARRASAPRTSPGSRRTAQAGLPWAPEAEVRILRVPPFAQGIARRAVEEYVLEKSGRRDRHRHGQVARRGHREAAAHPHAAHHGHRLGRGDRAGGAEGGGAAQGHEGGGARRRPRPGGGRGRDEVPDHGARGAPPARGHRPHRLDRGGLAAPARGAAHRAPARPEHRRALRPRARDLARHHPGDGREQAGHDRGRRVRRRDHDGDVQRDARPPDPRGGRGRERHVAPRCGSSSRRRRRRASPGAPSATSRRRWTSARWTSRR